jgi:hypothetical protein
MAARILYSSKNYFGSLSNPGVDRHVGKHVAAKHTCTCLYRRCICCCYERTFNPVQTYSINNVKVMHDSSYFTTVNHSIKRHEPYESNPHRRTSMPSSPMSSLARLLTVNLYTQFLFLLLLRPNNDPATV